MARVNWVTGEEVTAGAMNQIGQEINQLSGFGFQHREYSGSWPQRGNVPDGTIVIWIKRNALDPNPPVGGNGMAPSDIALLAQET